jgi:type I restriction enzyme, S subunit
MSCEGWADIRLGDVCTKIGSGATPRGGADVYLTHGPYALIRSQNVYNDGFHPDGLAYIGEEHAMQLDNVEVRPGDVLLNITGDSVARCCAVDSSVLPARVNQHVAIVRPDPQKLDPRFLRYFLVSPLMQAKMQSWAGAGATRNALTKGMIESFNVSAPRETKEQAAIGAVLGRLDDKIALNQRVNETLEGIVRALFKSWFVDFDPVRAKAGTGAGLPKGITDLFPDSFEKSDNREVPKGWRIGTIRECCDRVENGGTPRRNVAEYWEPREVPWLTSGEVRQKMVIDTENRISRNGLENSSAKLWPKETTVVALYGATAGQVTLAANSLSANQACCALIAKPNWRYFVYLHASSSVQALEQQARGSAQQNLSQQLVADLPTVICDKQVCKAFDDQVAPLFKKWVSNLCESQTLAAVRDTLLPKLISGELRINDAERIALESGL